jgi:hypothetical protein
MRAAASGRQARPVLRWCDARQPPGYHNRSAHAVARVLSAPRPSPAAQRDMHEQHAGLVATCSALEPVPGVPQDRIPRHVAVRMCGARGSEGLGSLVASLLPAAPRPASLTASAAAPLQVVMDGNSRWARQRGMDAAYGHQAGVQSLRQLVQSCGRFGIPALTVSSARPPARPAPSPTPMRPPPQPSRGAPPAQVFALSAENWRRPAAEVALLLAIFEQVRAAPRRAAP